MTAPGKQDLKVRENRLRRMAERQGLALEKSRARYWRVDDHGGYRVVDGSNSVKAGGRYELTLNEVEKYLVGNQQAKRAEV
jgi:hypothetical protein